jgi:predicted transcriptional regulator
LWGSPVFYISEEVVVLKGLKVLDLVRVKRLNYSQLMRKVNESSLRLRVILDFLLQRGYVREVRERNIRWFESEEKGRKTVQGIIGAKADRTFA